MNVNNFFHSFTSSWVFALYGQRIRSVTSKILNNILIDRCQAITKLKEFRRSIWRTVFYHFFGCGYHCTKKWCFPLRISSVNVTKSAVYGSQNSKTYPVTLKKNLSHLAGLAHLHVFTFLSHLGHTFLSHIFISSSWYEQTMFIKSFLKKGDVWPRWASHFTRQLTSI